MTQELGLDIVFERNKDASKVSEGLKEGVAWLSNIHSLLVEIYFFCGKKYIVGECKLGPSHLVIAELKFAASLNQH